MTEDRTTVDREPAASDADPALEYLYKEYVRLADRFDGLVTSWFDDFKLLAAVGAVAAWPPLADLLAADRERADVGLILLGGFGVILVIVGIIAIRDVYKQSVIDVQLLQLDDYERELRRRLCFAEKQAFHFATDWREWRDRTHPLVTGPFVFLFLVVVVGFPVAVFSHFDAGEHIGSYLGLVGVVAIALVAANVARIRAPSRRQRRVRSPENTRGAGTS